MRRPVHMTMGILVASLVASGGLTPAAAAPGVPSGQQATPGRGDQTGRASGGPGAGQPEAEPNTYEIYHSKGSPLVRVEGEPEAPVHHTVVQGDTLWGLCDRYFQDPWRWPRIWAINPGITNPHFIYPGDRIRLQKGAAPAAAKGAPTAGSTRPSTPGGTIYLRQRSFIEEEALKASARIAGSREEKILLATHDHVYVSYPAEKPLKVGERYAVFKALQPVVHPNSKETLGQMVEVYGEVEILELSKANVARGVILRAVNPVERGYLVGKLSRTLAAVKPIPNPATRVQGTVVTVLEQNHLIGARQLVFMDRGRKFHIKVGYTFTVTRRGDSFRASTHFEEQVKPSEQDWPKQRVADIVVVEVGWNHSVGYVTRSDREIRVGDRVELMPPSPSKP